MSFSSKERARLLSVKGVGPKVVERLEQLGIHDLATLASRDAAEICSAVSAGIGSSCWKNSPQARNAIQAAILMAAADRGV